jgi:hypothetical protein
MTTTSAQAALQALEDCLKHFTRSPSTLSDSTARANAHAAIVALRQFIEGAELNRADAERWRDLCSLTEYGHLCVLGKDDIQLDTQRELELAVDDDDAQSTAKAFRHAIAARSAEQKDKA